MEGKSKIIYDINAIESFRKMLVFQYKTPAIIIGLFFILSYILRVSRISNPIFPLIMFLIITPPVLFTPFFVYVLLKEKRYGWLTTYFLMVILPGIIILITFWDDISKIEVLLFLVLPFYLFCFFIKFSVEEWIREYTWEQQLIQQRK